MIMKTWMVSGKDEAVTGSVYYDSDGICNIFDGSEWVKLFAWTGEKNKKRVSSIEGIFSLNIRKNNR